jgi:hypothetical protein
VKPRAMLGIDRRRTGDGECGDSGDSKLVHASLLEKLASRWSRFFPQSTYSLDIVPSVTKM